MPAQIGAPSPLTSFVGSSPLGHASVIFTAPSWWYDGSIGRIALVGAVTDDYRLVSEDVGGNAGEQAVLSPDGGRLATVGRITDLVTGESTALPALDAEFVVPQAWSRAGDQVAVIAYVAPYATQPDGVMVPTTTKAALHLVNAASGAATRLADLDPGGVVDGWTVAFAPDGERIAFQTGRTVVVTRRDGVETARFDIPPGSRLAGRGAWTPDGHLTLVTQRRCCDGDAYQSRWTLSMVDASTGAVTTPAWTELSEVAAVRLLAWSPDGRALIVAYDPEPGTPVVDFDTGRGTLGTQLTDYEWIRSARVLSVGPGAPPTVLVAGTADQVALSVDAADNVLASGAVRPGRPPYWTFERMVLWALPVAGVLLVLAGGVTLVVITAVRRRTRARQRVS
jgi:hypothetical protein